MRCSIREVAKFCQSFGVQGWRQSKDWIMNIKEKFLKVNTARKWTKRTEHVKDYLETCEPRLERAEQSFKELEELHAGAKLLNRRKEFIEAGRRQVKFVRRRLLQGEKIAAKEKVHTIFEPHRRWINQGKAGVMVELGVPTCIIEDPHQFILHHEIMWAGINVNFSLPRVENTQQKYPRFQVCSFDRGFHNMPNRERLDEILRVKVLPKNGKLSKKEKERQQETEFAQAQSSIRQ